MKTLILAATLRLLSGAFSFDNVLYGDGPFHIEGRQFTMEGRAMSARLDAADCSFGCAPKETVSLYFTVGGNDAPGVATLGDQDFVDVGGLNSLEQLIVEMVGTTKAPRGTSDSPRTTRQAVNYTITFYHEGTREVMRGTATAVITWTLYDDFWYIDTLTYKIGR